MCKSMTGYGVAEFFIGEDKLSLEMKSANHRFIEINIKLPDRFSILENKVRDVVKRHCARGSFYISIIYSGEISSALKVNIPLAKHYYGALQELQKGLGLEGEIDISMLLKFRDIFSAAEADKDMERDWGGLKRGLEQALNSLVSMREEEGGTLSEDISSRLNYMEAIVLKMVARVPIVTEVYRKRLREKIAGVLDTLILDETKLAAEVALFAERSDITEELVRLRNHLSQFRDTLKLDEPVGRRMDFLCQEILRELNTIGSKANDFELASLVVTAKAELEKIREQAQNVE